MCKGSLNLLTKSSLYEDNFRRITNLEGEIEKLEYQEELHYKHRARTYWLCHEDRNTKFFQSFATERRNHNFIKGLFRRQTFGIPMKMV